MILIVSDNRHHCRPLLTCVERISENCELVCTSSGVIQRCLQKRYPVIIIDSYSKLTEHFELIAQLQSKLPDSAIIVMAHQGCDSVLNLAPRTTSSIRLTPPKCKPG